MQSFSIEAGERFRKRLIVTAKGRHEAKDMTWDRVKEALAVLHACEDMLKP